MSKKDKTGYKNPPKKNQFGQKNGNPINKQGRPKRKNLKESLKEIINEKVTVKVNGEIKTMTAYEAVLSQTVSLAGKGDKDAQKLLHKMLMDTGTYKKDIDDFEKYCLRMENEDIFIIDDEPAEDDD
jgi:hypothetical protein